MRVRGRKAKENAVKLVVDLIEKKIEPEFNIKGKYLSRLSIHKTPKNKYFSFLYSIVLYAEEIKGNNSNTVSSIITDYLISVYKHYSRFSRTPKLNQLSPSTSNRIRFQEWIYEFERERSEDYLIAEEESPIDEFVFEFEQNFESEILEV